MKYNIKIELLLLFFFFPLLSACSFKEDSLMNPSNPQQETIKNNETKDFVEPYVDDNPITLGLYLKKDNSRTLITSYDSPLIQYQDIVSLEVYYTKDQTLSSQNQKNLWHQYYQNYQNIDTYKIGYHISFKIGERKVSKNILTPNDVLEFFDYIQIYLYDDIHQESSWYDHISEEEVQKDTIFTSIKLTASTKIAEITSPITLKAFTYNEDDFDKLGEYRGKSDYQVTINRQG